MAAPTLEGYLTSPDFVVGVVVGGLLVNLLGAYAKGPLDRFLARSSERQRRLLEHARQKVIDALAKAEREPNGLVFVAIEEVKALVITLFFAGLSLALLAWTLTLQDHPM